MFSLGCVLFRAATGRDAFPGPNGTYEVKQGTRPAFPARSTPTAAALDAVLGRLFDRNAVDAIGTAAELSAELKRVERESQAASLVGTPPPAGDPPTPELVALAGKTSGQRVSAANRAVVGNAAAAVIGLQCLTILATLQTSLQDWNKAALPRHWDGDSDAAIPFHRFFATYSSQIELIEGWCVAGSPLRAWLITVQAALGVHQEAILQALDKRPPAANTERQSAEVQFSLSELFAQLAFQSDRLTVMIGRWQAALG